MGHREIQLAASSKKKLTAEYAEVAEKI